MGRALTLLIMGILSSLGAAIGGTAISAGISSILGTSAGDKEYEHQKGLMALQQKYARENAATANTYARQNALDAASLEKLGKQQAGINTAFAQNGNVTSVGSGPLAGTPSAPGPIGYGSTMASLQGSFAQNISSISQALLQQEQAKKAASERTGIDIDNITRAAENAARITKYGSETAKNNAEASLTELQTRFKQDTYDSEVSIRNSEQTIADANAKTQYEMNLSSIDAKLAAASRDIASGALSYQEIENKKEEIKNLRKERDEISSRIDVNKSTVKLNGAKAFEAWQNGHLSGSRYLFQEIQNTIADATKDDVIELAHREVTEHGPKSVSEYTWNNLNKWDKLSNSQKFYTFLGLVTSGASEILQGAGGSAVQGYAFGAGMTKGQNVVRGARPKIGFFK